MKKILLWGMTVITLSAGIYLLIHYLSEKDEIQSPVVLQSNTFPAVTYQSGPFTVGITIDPLKPVIGSNEFILQINDMNNNPVTNVNIRAVATMASMGTMPAMQAPAEIQEVMPGMYEGSFSIPMDGAWPLTLEISKEGVGNSRLVFDLNTRSTGLKLLSPVTQQTSGENSNDGTVYIDSRRRQSIGLKTSEVTRVNYRHSIRAVGEVKYDETRLADISLRFDAWIGDLKADFVGKHVNQGEELFTVYGPDLLAAQQEYLEILKRNAPEENSLVSAARKRLALLNMDDLQIRHLEQRKTTLDYVPIMSPRTGTIVNKQVFEGSAHKAGVNLMRIADLSVVWVEADIYESELSLITPGMEAEIVLPYLPDKIFSGRIVYIYPYLDGDTRTGRIRLSLDNVENLLKPAMYAEVNLKVDLGLKLMIPEEAIIFAGTNRIVFKEIGNGELQPVRIKTGLRTRDYVEVLDGIEEGDQIVTSGTFLIAAESKLKSGLNQW